MCKASGAFILFEKKSQLFENLNDAYIISGLLIFRAVVEPRISSKSAKSCEIHKKTRNPAKFARNLAKYMSAQHILKVILAVGAVYLL